MGNKIKTSIQCSMGPASDSVDILAAMMDAGMDVVRINLSHGTAISQADKYDTFRKALEKHGADDVKIMYDLCGPNVRVKELPYGVISYKEGEEMTDVAPTEEQKNGQILWGQVHDPLARVMNGGISGNAGLFTTADDIAVICAMIQNGGSWNGKTIFSPATIKTMRTVPESLKEHGRALGWDSYSDYSGHKGDLLSRNTICHTGYTGTSIVIDQDNDLSIIILTNAVHPHDKSGMIRIYSLVSNAVAGAIIK